MRLDVAKVTYLKRAAAGAHGQFGRDDPLRAVRLKLDVRAGFDVQLGAHGGGKRRLAFAGNDGS